MQKAEFRLLKKAFFGQEESTCNVCWYSFSPTFAKYLWNGECYLLLKTVHSLYITIYRTQLFWLVCLRFYGFASILIFAQNTNTRCAICVQIARSAYQFHSSSVLSHLLFDFFSPFTCVCTTYVCMRVWVKGQCLCVQVYMNLSNGPKFIQNISKLAECACLNFAWHMRNNKII